MCVAIRKLGPRLAALVFTVALALSMAGCATPGLRGYRALQIRDGSAPATATQISVQTGQIIVSEHATGTSLAISLIAERFARYTHVGLVVIDEGRPFVYEAMGAYIPLPWQPPNALMAGGVRRVPLEDFVARGGIVAIYDPPPGVDATRAAEFVRQQRRERRGFDGHYDPRDDGTYYCVEFVVRALEAAGAPALPPARATRNPSMRIALEWLDVRTPEFLLAGDLVEESRRFALLSKEFTSAQVERYFALKAELHRRFTVDQKLGYLFRWDKHSLRLRPAVDRFTDDAMASAEEPRVLADRVFGAIGNETALAEAVASSR
jgi:hypothetical protein